MEQNQNTSGAGSIIGIIIIIGLIILGGLYFWGKRTEDAEAVKNLSEGTSEVTDDASETATIKNTSNSDDLNSIETDLNDTNLDNLDIELK